MTTLEQVSDYLYQVCDKVSFNGKDHFHCRCPLCGDSKKSKHKKRFHLHFDNEQSIFWQCWNCGLSGNFYELYAQLEGCNVTDAYRLFNTYNKEMLLNRLNRNKKVKETKVYNKQTFNYILNDCISINDNPNGYIQTQYYKLLKQFINSRYLDYTVYIAYKGDYKGRIIIPIWDDNDIVFFQGRSTNSQMEPKYLNPKVEKSQIIFNKNNFHRNKYIIVTEGIIDADNIGTQGTTILGKELTQEFIDNISQYTDTGIIIVMDNDKDGYNKLNDYIQKFTQVKYFVMPKKYCMYKDLNDLVTNNIINKSDLYEFVTINSYSSLKCKLKLLEV